MSKKKSSFKALHYFRHSPRECGFCRFSRALAFSGIGAWLGYYGAVFVFASSEFNALIYAFFGALSLVLLTSERPKPKTFKRRIEQDESEE